MFAMLQRKFKILNNKKIYELNFFKFIESYIKKKYEKFTLTTYLANFYFIIM